MDLFIPYFSQLRLSKNTIKKCWINASSATELSSQKECLAIKKFALKRNPLNLYQQKQQPKAILFFSNYFYTNSQHLLFLFLIITDLFTNKLRGYLSENVQEYFIRHFVLEN